MAVQTTHLSIWQTAFEQTYLSDKARAGVAADMRKSNLNERSGVADFYLSGWSQGAHMFSLPYDHYMETAYSVKPASGKVLLWSLAKWDPEKRNVVKGIVALVLQLAVAIVALPKNMLKLSELMTLAISLKSQQVAENSKSWFVAAPAFGLAALTYVAWAALLRPTFGPLTSLKAARDKLRPNIEKTPVPITDESGNYQVGSNNQVLRVTKSVPVPKPTSMRARILTMAAISVLITLGVWMVGLPLLYAKLLPFLPHQMGAAAKGVTHYLSSVPHVGSTFALYGDLATLALINLVGLALAFVYTGVESYAKGEKIMPQPRRPLPTERQQRPSRSQGARLQSAVGNTPANDVTLQLEEDVSRGLENSDEQVATPTLASTPISGEIPIGMVSASASTLMKRSQSGDSLSDSIIPAMGSRPITPTL